MSVTPQEVVHRLRRLRLGPPFAGFAALEATVDVEEFNRSDWHTDFPAKMRLVWRHGQERRAIGLKFKVSVYTHTADSLDALLRTKVRQLLAQAARTAEVTLE